MLLDKKYFFSFFLLVIASSLSAQTTRIYAEHSVLASGKWHKVAVVENGIYKIDYDFVKTNCGIEPSSVSFGKIAVFGNGGGMIPERNAIFRYDDIQENAVWRIDQNGNGKMDAGDYILFYGEGADKWFYNSSSKTFSHEKNIYADENYYFLTTTEGTGKNISSVASPETFTHSANTFTDYAFHEKEEYNLLTSGRRWLGDKMNSYASSVSFSFNFPNRIAEEPIAYVSAVANASKNPATIAVSVNGQSKLVHNCNPRNTSNSSYEHTDASDTKNGSFLASGDQLNFIYSYSNADQTNNSNGYIDYLEVNVSRALVFGGNMLLFRNPKTIGTGSVTNFNISGTNTNIKIWDVTDPVNVRNIQAQLNGNTLSFNTETETLKEFAAVNIHGSFAAPTVRGEVANQDLHGLGAVDYIIVTDKSLLSAAQDLANYHSHLKTVVVDKALIYNEFGSGKQDLSAIRDFVKMFYDRANGDAGKKPKYLLLFGDASYDYKDRIANNTNLVPTYESVNSHDPLNSYNTDDFFGCLDDNEGGDMVQPQQGDIAIGRLPVGSVEEAQGMVNKIKSYKTTQTLGEWRNMVTVIGDETGHGADFQDQANEVGEYIRLNYSGYNIEKIICDAYRVQKTSGGDRYPDVNAAILNRINSGALVMGYTGHGGVNNLSYGRIFNIAEIQQLKNNRLPLFVTATCDFSKFDDPGKKSAGEVLINNPNGGAIASVTTVRVVFANENHLLQMAFFKRLFEEVNGQKPTLGELMNNAKNDQIQMQGNSDFVMRNIRKFVLLGDPALILNYPEYNVVTTEINNRPVAENRDTLSALKRVTIKGQIQTWDGNLLSSFNGICYPVVYDKLGSFNTLGNTGAAIKTYNSYKNILFKGACSVENGEFEFSFIVPKDINYQIGDGRISYYADNGILSDAHGYNNSIPIGGSSDSFDMNVEAPKVQLFMGDSTFKSGGITSENPSLFAILEAEGGINTSGNGLGHDITAVLDEETNSTLILNDYYASELNNFQRGTITYPFSNLAEGRHTLRLKAWDVYNNSAEDEIEFVVSSSAAFALSEIMNYPNPLIDYTCFSFEHNKAGENLDVTIQIYTATGSIVKTIQQSMTASGFRSGCIEWDGTNDAGGEIQKGIYIYRVQVREETGQTAHKSERLVVLK